MTPALRIVELFCGTKSFSKAAIARGHAALTMDFNPKYRPDMVADILYTDFHRLPAAWHKPDILWCSPPCESFSLAGSSLYLGFPVSAKHYIGFALAYKCLEAIRDLKPRYFIIENPRAGLRAAWFMRPLQRATITYCQYGYEYMKPTDLFNNFGFKGRACTNRSPCHKSAPRGSKTGLQGEKSKESRYSIPPMLCAEILDFIEKLEIVRRHGK